MDRSGTWHPECDFRGCHFDQADDGLIEIDVPILGEFRTVRIHVCADHRDQFAPRPMADATAA